MIPHLDMFQTLTRERDKTEVWLHKIVKYTKAQTDNFLAKTGHDGVKTDRKV